MSYVLNKMSVPAKNPHNFHLTNIHSFLNTKKFTKIYETAAVFNNKLFFFL